MKPKDRHKLFHFKPCHKEQGWLLIREILMIAVLTEICNSLKQASHKVVPENKKLCAGETEARNYSSD